MRSVWIHYAALHLIFEHSRTPANVGRLVQRLARGSFVPLPEKPIAFSATLAHIACQPIASHRDDVERWARCAYAAWESLRALTVDLVAPLL